MLVGSHAFRQMLQFAATARSATKDSLSMSEAEANPRGSRRRPVVIDFHAHAANNEVNAATYDLSVLGRLRASGEGSAIHAMPEAHWKRMTDLPTRLADMDTMGVDIQVISPNILHNCTYSLPVDEALRLEQIGNDHIAETVAKKPDRLVGIASVPLQSTELAIKEMERATGELGLKGLVIASRAHETDLGDASLRPFWRRAEALGVPIFIHPAGNPDPRLRKHSMLISLGQPLEEAYAQCSLIYDGVMDECPDLKIAFAHGGGFIPYYSGRFDWLYSRGTTKQIKGDISSYLRAFHYESVVFDPAVLERLADKVSTSHIMLGTDYPFGEWKPVELIRNARRILEAAREDMLGANAAKFLGIAL
ncbi:MAG: amidohydrolase family protein [Rhizobiales bacterium]|nr:amidohydrolase family protein [Hyphomicrobiales bacterium]